MHQRPLVVQPVETSYRFIPLTQNKIAVVDAGDYDWLSQWSWCAKYDATRNCFYAVRAQGPRHRKNIFMHRAILGLDNPKEYVDHWDGDGLNNQRKNLRRCNNAQNIANRKPQVNNTSGFKGVSFKRGRNKWAANAYINKMQFHLGYFATAREAATAYDEVLFYRFGEFAKLNFPNTTPAIRETLRRKLFNTPQGQSSVLCDSAS